MKFVVADVRQSKLQKVYKHRLPLLELVFDPVSQDRRPGKYCEAKYDISVVKIRRKTPW